MSEPSIPSPVKLIFSLFSVSGSLIDSIIEELVLLYGKTDYSTPLKDFDYTYYYHSEMGSPLKRKIISMKELIKHEGLVDIKLKTNEIENLHLNESKGRRINIDPGVISKERLVLATGKNAPHRVYLERGIYADLTLIFEKGDFKPQSWTYPDYASDEYRSIFKEIRDNYLLNLKDIRDNKS